MINSVSTPIPAPALADDVVVADVEEAGDEEEDGDGGVKVGDSNVARTADSSAARLGKSPANVIRAERRTERYVDRAEVSREGGRDMIGSRVGRMRQGG